MCGYVCEWEYICICGCGCDVGNMGVGVVRECCYGPACEVCMRVRVGVRGGRPLNNGRPRSGRHWREVHGVECVCVDVCGVWVCGCVWVCVCGCVWSHVFRVVGFVCPISLKPSTRLVSKNHQLYKSLVSLGSYLNCSDLPIRKPAPDRFGHYVEGGFGVDLGRKLLICRWGAPTV